MTAERDADTDAGADAGRVRDEVRRRYATLAVTGDGCCGETGSADGDWGREAEGGAAVFGAGLYDAGDLVDVPPAAAATSLGCGDPVAVADLAEGETVLDLGSGGGIDVLLSAQRVGPTGLAYGLDMTDEMVALARRNAAEAGVDNVRFLHGEMEAIPLDDDSIDVVISNCVINLSPEKDAVFAELARVLRPAGRLGVSDVVAEDRLSPAERAERGSHVGCVAGALSISEYEAALTAAGFDDVTITPTHEVADGVHGAIVRGRAPA